MVNPRSRFAGGSSIGHIWQCPEDRRKRTLAIDGPQDYSYLTHPQYDRTDIDFTDGLAIDLLSPANRTFTITQNNRSLDGAFVSGANGEGWRSIQPYSYVIKVNEPANDLIGKVELPYDPVMLKTLGIDQADTAVGKLAPDGKSWMIAELQRNVHV